MKPWALVLPLALGLVQAGCDLLTETPRSTIVAETFYRTEADAKAAIVATYQPLASGFGGGSLQWALNAAADDARIGSEEENPVIQNLTRLNFDSRNGNLGGAWTTAYTIITRANLVLEKVPGIAMSEANRRHILAEARFLRALMYFYLVRLYGDVPLVRTAADQLALGPRSPKEEVYARIREDAEAAEAELPISWDPANLGRATKGAAQALRAELYLWRSTREGTGEWGAAAAAAKKIIDSGTYRLETNWINAFLPGSQNRGEEIFAAQASSTTGASTITIASWTYPRAMDPQAAGGWGTWQPLAWFAASYANGDYRAQTGAQAGLPGPNGVGFFTSGRTASGVVVTFPAHVYKYRPTSRPGQQDVNYPIYRYADVLLMYAEALNELGQPAEAIRYMNLVRARAREGVGGENRPQPADLPVMSQAATREAIFRERHWELAFESKRWFDMVRRGRDYFLASLQRDPTATSADANDMLWPIPQSQIDVNPALTQNPGY
jgi:starch-binding outer membrane protein, SusD/RagB family